LVLQKQECRSPRGGWGGGQTRTPCIGCKKAPGAGLFFFFFFWICRKAILARGRSLLCHLSAHIPKGEAFIDRSLKGKTDPPPWGFVRTGQNSGGMCCIRVVVLWYKNIRMASLFFPLSFLATSHLHTHITTQSSLYSLSLSIIHSLLLSSLLACKPTVIKVPADGRDPALSFSRNHRCRQDRL